MQREENNGFGPLYRQRGSAAIWVAISILTAFSVVTFLAERPLQHKVLAFYFFAISLSLLAWVIGEMARRLCLFVEEARHCHSRYEGRMKKALKATFDYKKSDLISLFTIVFSLGMSAFFLDIWDSCKTEFLRFFGVNAIFIPLFVFLFGLHKLSRVEYAQINEKVNKNLADGLAWGYYFGYLKFVLPALENQINLTEKYRYKIDIHKVFIIIPKNCYVFEQISNKQSDPKGLIKSDGNLEPLKKIRGGQTRIYKHTVHSIKDEDTGKTYYCIMEYATPLMNLFDMSNDPNAGLSREERDNQVNLFVAKLRDILDHDVECKDKYKLVTFSGENQDIGKIMIRALKDCTLELGVKE